MKKLMMSLILLVSVSNVRAADMVTLENDCKEGNVYACVDFCNESYELDWDTQDQCEELELENAYNVNK